MKTKFISVEDYYDTPSEYFFAGALSVITIYLIVGMIFYLIYSF